MTIAQDLKAVNKNIQAIGKTLDRLLKAVEKEEKPKATPTKKIPAKKAPAKKMAAQPTATDEILKIIKASKKGVDAPTLVKKTGFNQKKVRNILFRTFKQGRIKRLDKGIYTGV
jgi:hypothetical protein